MTLQTRVQVREQPPVSAAAELLTHLVSPAASGVDAAPGSQVGFPASAIM